MSLSNVGAIPAVTATGTTVLWVAVMEGNFIEPSFSGDVFFDVALAAGGN